MRSVGARREYKKRGQTARQLILPTESIGVWPRKVLAAADSDDRCKRLLAAVLCDAISALRGKHPNGRKSASGDWLVENPRTLWAEASQWIMSREQEAITDFETICDVLELEVGEVRRDLCALAAEYAGGGQWPAAVIA